MRYFAELLYKGTAYHGWQIQKNAPSVQGALQSAMSTLLRENVEITGAGRTDTGVHASFYVAHFDTAAQLDDSFAYHLNSLLPQDIAVSRIYLVTDEAHARFDALEREYKYYILDHKDPFRRDTTWQYYVPLCIDSMNEAACYLLEAEDFTTFSKLHSNNKTNICEVRHAEWEQKEGEAVFTIRADRFLRNMVRSIVGTLVDVGRGKIKTDNFRKILESRDRSLASGSAPARGLFLTDVAYPPNLKTNTK